MLLKNCEVPGMIGGTFYSMVSIISRKMLRILKCLPLIAQIAIPQMLNLLECMERFAISVV
ncbi:hypothetical protein KDK_39360 [Dictyobacter kobayashii]|uniref:Uncharacterized protein n=1 Tax=Dictyobacter kobayashii TaxID=2014872 RepID=A0A402ALZ9_9CHLR|nr:hypothetical protein KDK_39360 [Dictyobacter kobayashii]